LDIAVGIYVAKRNSVKVDRKGQGIYNYIVDKYSNFKSKS